MFRLLRKDYDLLSRGTERMISSIVQKFEGTGSIGDKVKRMHNQGAQPGK